MPPTDPRPPKPPKHLSRVAKQWWSQVNADFDLKPHHVLILTAACEALDQAEIARQKLIEDGPVIKDRFDQDKLNPAAIAYRNARQTFLTCVKALQLDHDPETPSC